MATCAHCSVPTTPWSQYWHWLNQSNYRRPVRGEVPPTLRQLSKNLYNDIFWALFILILCMYVGTIEEPLATCFALFAYNVTHRQIPLFIRICYLFDMTRLPFKNIYYVRCAYYIIKCVCVWCVTVYLSLNTIKLIQ